MFGHSGAQSTADEANTQAQEGVVPHQAGLLGSVLTSAGRYQEAEVMLLDARRELESLPGGGGEEMKMANARLADVLHERAAERRRTARGIRAALAARDD